MSDTTESTSSRMSSDFGEYDVPLHPDKVHAVGKMSDTIISPAEIARSSSPASNVSSESGIHQFHIEYEGATDQSKRAACERMRKIKDLYASGKPFFSRAVLADLVEQLEQHPRSVKMVDFVDNSRREYVLAPPYWLSERQKQFQNEASYTVDYNSYEDLTRPERTEHVFLRNIENPIKFNYTYGKHKETQTIEDIEAAWEENERLWVQSNDCAALKQQLASHARHLIGQVKKIVCFGLGSLHWDERYAPDQRATSFVQHAAIKTLQDFFNSSDVGPNVQTDVHKDRKQPVRVLIQDPWYSDVDKAFLTKTGFSVIENPKGFLEVDDHSLVFSVSPNVPVKQIVADMARPAAMLWNTVEEENIRTYRCTDPDSARVREMVESYEQLPLQEDDMPHFWHCTIYLRKSGHMC